MALASQSGRSSSRRSYMSSRRRPQRRRLLALLFLVACAVAVGWWWFQADDSAEGPERVADGTPVDAGTDAGAPASRATPPSEITLDPGPARAAIRPEAPRIAGRNEVGSTKPGPPTNVRDAAEPGGEKRPDPTTATGPRTLASSADASTALAEARRLAASDPVAARKVLTDAWTSDGLSTPDRSSAMSLARELADLTLLDRANLPANPFVTTYKVRSGDSLDRIVRREDADVDKMFLARINNLSNPNAIRIGQELRLPTGSFDAVVDKSDYTMTLFQRNESGRTMLVALPVGLGEFNATPTGLFRVRVNSKLVNPHWINPRTREEFKANDPANPIGEHWIGLEGIEDANRDVDGYGIHGTIDPDSIGRQMSMGCVRMLGDDVELVYEVLTHPSSTIEIRE